MGIIISVAHSDISRTARLSSVCVHRGGSKMAEYGE